VGSAPGTESSLVYALSQNGSIAAGVSFTTTSFAPGFIWTRESGRNDYGAGQPGFTGASALSSDGSAIAGTMYNSIAYPPPSRAYRRVGSGPLVDLGVVPGNTRSFARGISGDGNTVVGGCEWSSSTGAVGQAFRWTPQGGIQGLGFAFPNGTLSRASGISRDGSTIVGLSQSGGTAGHQDAFVWREGQGMQALPGLPGNGWTEANAVSADGRVIVGDAETTLHGLDAVRWTASGIQDLGVPPGYFGSTALAVSDDGLVIGGRTSEEHADIAFVWTPSTGPVLLSDYLLAAGITPPAGYRLSAVRAISADGLTFAGYATNLQTFVQQGFVATVPTPSSSLILLLLPALRRRPRPTA
jgi:uncharacterized membrane protein